jgi:hypothetical protein
MASRALEWMHTHRELGGFPDTPAAELDDPDAVYKPLGEATLAASLVLREGVAGTAQLAAARDLLDFTWTQLRAGDLLYERQLRHGLIVDPLELYSHHARCGYRHARLEELLRSNARIGSMTEVLPNRRLAVANAYRVLGIERDDDWAAMTRATWLGSTPEPWAIDWLTAYCVTHTVFHLTDWGARPDGLPEDVAGYLATWLPVWIDIWSEVEQWDLVGELLIVGVCLPEPRCAPAEWERLAAQQHDDGLVPRDGRPVTDDPVRRFLDHQHTAVVAAVAGTLAVSRLLDRR